MPSQHSRAVHAPTCVPDSALVALLPFFWFKLVLTLNLVEKAARRVHSFLFHFAISPPVFGLQKRALHPRKGAILLFPIEPKIDSFGRVFSELWPITSEQVFSRMNSAAQFVLLPPFLLFSGSNSTWWKKLHGEFTPSFFISRYLRLYLDYRNVPYTPGKVQFSSFHRAQDRLVWFSIFGVMANNVRASFFAHELGHTAFIPIALLQSLWEVSNLATLGLLWPPGGADGIFKCYEDGPACQPDEKLSMHQNISSAGCGDIRSRHIHTHPPTHPHTHNQK